MTALTVKNLKKIFDDYRFPAVCDVSFSIQPGEILSLLGPSGSGKTTILRLIAGLEQLDAGEIYINQQKVAGREYFVQPENRGVGMVFQDHALFPHLTVQKNIAFGLKQKKSEQTRLKVQAMMQLVNLEKYAHRYPHELSGGERQRVALARALAPQPVLVLMDEPFSSLDTDLRMAMREQVRNLFEKLTSTVIFVTHDQDEALYMGDRVAVINQGRLEQIGKPETIFEEADSRFVAEFMGGSHFIPATVIPEGIETELGVLFQPCHCSNGSCVEVAVRADDIQIKPDMEGNATICERIYRGMLNLYRFKLDSGIVLEAMMPHTTIYPEGTRIKAYLDPGHPLRVFEKLES